MKTNALNTLTFVMIGMTFATGMVFFPTNLCAQEGKSTATTGEIRVGTFDSRAVALAWYRSTTFKKELTQMYADLKTAQEKKDDAKIKELEIRGPALQDLMHKQGFSVWPIDNVMDKIKDKMPAVADQSGVSLVVSKWDIVYQKKGLKLVDVTDQMVALFDPDEETRKIVAEIRKKKPVPVDQIEPTKR